MNSEIESGVFILKLLQSLTLLLGIAAVIVGFISFARRKPPIAEELYRDFATIVALNNAKKDMQDQVGGLRQEYQAALTGMRQEYLASVDELFNLQRALTAATEDSLRGIARTLGRHDGKLENCPGPQACALDRAGGKPS
jgi:hypothetical protein